jgi:hypothetical protein
MTDSRIEVVIDDGPRGGQSITVETETDGTPPPEILLPDHHFGDPYAAGAPRSTGAVSRYRLVPDGSEGRHHYRVVPHDNG